MTGKIVRKLLGGKGRSKKRVKEPTMAPLSATVLWAVKKGDADWREVIIYESDRDTEVAEHMPKAKKWALANGFDRLRVATISLTEKPDFGRTVR